MAKTKTDPKIVKSLNQAREKAVKSGKSAYGGNLKDYGTFAKSLTSSSKNNVTRGGSGNVGDSTGGGSLPDPESIDSEENLGGGNLGESLGGKCGGGLDLSDIFTQFGISASLPAVDRDDITKQTKREMGSSRRAIGNRYDEAIGDAEEAAAQENRALQGQMGTGRRFSSSAQAFIQHIDNENNKKIANLEVQRDDALANYDFKLAELVESRIKDERQAQRDQITDVLSLLSVAEKAQSIGGGKVGDEKIVELIESGITDPGKILVELNKAGGDYSLTEVREALDALDPGASSGALFKLDEKGVATILAEGSLSAADIKGIQTDLNAGFSLDDVLGNLETDGQRNAVRKALGIGNDAENLTPGLGAADGLEESMIRTRLFDKVASIVGLYPLSDADREFVHGKIAYYRDQGLGEQEIYDALSGWPSDAVSPYNNSLRDIIFSNAGPEENVSGVVSQTATLLKGGKYTQAVNKIENFAMEKAKAETGYMGKIATETYTDRIDEIKQLLIDGGAWDGTGYIEGNFNKMLGRLKGRDAATMKAKLTSLYQTFRKENAGVAVTETEIAFLNDLFADINDPKGNFLAKLDTFQTRILQEHNATRRNVGLPEVKVKDILDPAEKLRLYSDDIYIGSKDTLDL